MKKLHIVGLGLLGGSFALAAKKKFPEILITGWDISSQNLHDAHTLGMLDRSQELPDQDTDVAIIATPADTLPALIANTLDHVTANTLIVDLGSTKENICKSLAEHPKRKQYLAAHPIAGTEYSGPRAAFGELLNRKVMILCEMEKTDLHLKEKAYTLFDALNMKLRFMDPEEHDRQLAFVSHLSHISSFMLGKTVLQKMEDDKNIFDMAGSGFASTVRLAKSSPAMWAPIFLENKANILSALDGYIANLQEMRNDIAAGEGEKMKADMNDINSIRDILDLPG